MTGELDQPEVPPILFPRSPAFRQGTFYQIWWSGVGVTFAQRQKERLVYKLVDKPLEQKHIVVKFVDSCQSMPFTVWISIPLPMLTPFLKRPSPAKELRTVLFPEPGFPTAMTLTGSIVKAPHESLAKIELIKFAKAYHQTSVFWIFPMTFCS